MTPDTSKTVTFLFRFEDEYAEQSPSLPGQSQPILVFCNNALGQTGILEQQWASPDQSIHLTLLKLSKTFVIHFLRQKDV